MIWKSISIRISGIFLLVLGFAACEDILEEPDLSERSVNLLGPADGVTVPDNRVIFRWEKVEDATSYRMQIARPDFEVAIQIPVDTLFEVDSLDRVQTSLTRSLANGNYTWRVKALNTGFETPYTTHTLVISGDPNADLDPPNTPQPQSPGEGASLDAPVDFSWTREDVPGTAELDSIYIYSDAGAANLVLSGIGANKTFRANPSSGTYYWRLRAFDTAGNASGFSPLRSFTVNE